MHVYLEAWCFFFQLKKNTSKTGSDVSIDQTTMNQLLGNMDNLTTTVQELKENYQKVSMLSMSLFNTKG